MTLTCGVSTGSELVTAVNELTSNNFSDQFFNGLDDRITNLADPQLAVSVSPTTASTIPSGVLIARDAYTEFELLSTRQSYIGTTSGYANSVAPSGASIPVVQGFYYDGQEIEFQYREVQGSFYLIVDGEVVVTYSVTSALNQPRWYKVDLGNTDLKKCYLVSTQALRGGITIEPSTNFYPTRTESASVAIMGDSITAGTGSSFGLSFPSGLRWKLGAPDTTPYGIGGSGYINNTGSGKFINRLQEVVDSGRDWLFVAGGINDVSISTVAEFQTAVDEFYTAALNDFAADRIVIISNWGTGATVDGSKTLQFRDVLEAKAIEIGAYFVDALRDQTLGGWITADNVFNLPDGTHPNNYMHNVYAHNIMASLCNKQLIL